MNSNALSRSNIFNRQGPSNSLINKFLRLDTLNFTLLGILSLISLNYFNMKLMKFIIQYFIDRSTISIASTKVSDATKDSIKMVCDSKIASSSPLGARVQFEEPAKLGFINSKGEIAWFGETDMPPLDMKPGPDNQIQLPLLVKFTDSRQFGEFSELLMQEKSVQFVMKGHVTIIALGFLKTKGVLMHKTIEIKGMDGLNQLSIKDVMVKRGDRSKIDISVSCKMLNPSDVSMSIGQVWFNMYYKDALIGTVQIPTLQLEPGMNSPPTKVHFHPDPNDPQAIELGRELMSNFTKGIDSECSIRGNHPNKQLPSYLSQGLSSLTITSTLNGLTIPLLKSAKMSMSPLDLVMSMAAFSVPTRLMVTNPFDEDFYIIKMTSEAIIKGVNIGSLNADLSHLPIKIQKRTTIETGLLTMKLNPMVEGFGAVAATLGEGNMSADIKATIEARVGNYSMIIDYEQEQVPVIVGL